MANKFLIPIVGIISITLGILVMVHQYVNWQKWFEVSDIHHETFIVGLFAFGIGLIWYANRKSRNLKVKL